jgi:predicted Mrr-cat superfamily restriction endonuclease
VAVPLKSKNEVLIGKVTGNYEYRQLSNFISHIRKVRWLKTISKGIFEEEYDVDLNTPEALFLIKTDSQKLSGLIETKSLGVLIEELNFALDDFDFLRERMLEFVCRLDETDDLEEVRKIAAEMEKMLREK